MFENGKFPTIEELLERGEHLIQKAVDGKRLSGEETYLSQTARSVVKQTGCFVGRSRAAVSGGRCVLSPPDCFVA